MQEMQVWSLIFYKVDLYLAKYLGTVVSQVNTQLTITAQEIRKDPI